MKIHDTGCVRRVTLQSARIAFSSCREETTPQNSGFNRWGVYFSYVTGIPVVGNPHLVGEPKMPLETSCLCVPSSLVHGSHAHGHKVAPETTHWKNLEDRKKTEGQRGTSANVAPL